MKTLNILICEGNTPEEGKIFQEVGIPTHTKSLKDSLSYYNKDLNPKYYPLMFSMLDTICKNKKLEINW